ncbi:uncharacterized protein LOC113359225 [Papaver somniferum]|uniref:uncharacterized protein LOC113359225 n=1 Tax=Papaver somniferum TaxID=3469 RepID=UPI000E6FCA4B|nr:uncharacterized protein LOC113359225 [Papaver somniferum]
MAPFEALYGRPCRSPICWTKVGDSLLTGAIIIAETTEIIRIIKERLRAAQSRQKSYACHSRRPLQFEVGKYVLLRVSPKKGITRFGLKEKLAPRFTGPFQIVEKIAEVAYRLALPVSMGQIHNIFYVYMLRGYESDSFHVLDWQSLPLEDNGSYKEGPIEILDQKEKVLRNKIISLVKVRWVIIIPKKLLGRKKSDMRAQYPDLFT